MNNFQYKFPHTIKNITPVRRFGPLDYRDTFTGLTDRYNYRPDIIESFEMELSFSDDSYKMLADYVTEKLELDEFIRYDPGARKLYDELLTYYHLKK